MHGGGRDPNGRGLDEEIRIGKEDWMERQRVAQGGRVEMKPGGLVEPGVTHYATKERILQTELDEAITYYSNKFPDLNEDQIIKSY